MIHEMKLKRSPFEAIASGEKTVEIRLNDEKRRKISINDTIVFSKLPDIKEKIAAKVVDLLKYTTFKEMLKDVPLKDYACDNCSEEETLDFLYSFYSKEEEKAWGVLGIKIELINS